MLGLIALRSHGQLFPVSLSFSLSSFLLRCFLWMILWVSFGNNIKGNLQAASGKLTSLWFFPSLQNHPFHPLWYPRQTFGKPPSIISIYITFLALMGEKMTNVLLSSVSGKTYERKNYVASCLFYCVILFVFSEVINIDI